MQISNGSTGDWEETWGTGGLGDRFPQFSTRYFFNLTKFVRDSRDSTYSIYGRLKVKYEEQIHCSDKHIPSMRKV